MRSIEDPQKIRQSQCSAIHSNADRNCCTHEILGHLLRQSERDHSAQNQHTCSIRRVAAADLRANNPKLAALVFGQTIDDCCIDPDLLLQERFEQCGYEPCRLRAEPRVRNDRDIDVFVCLLQDLVAIDTRHIFDCAGQAVRRDQAAIGERDAVERTPFDGRHS